MNVIAEIKKASPSKGVLRDPFDPVSIALSYQSHGASCLSILTESSYFQGSPEHLAEVAGLVDLPILRKDFMVDLRQMEEARLMGADAVLLIVAVLDGKELPAFREEAERRGLDCLVEVHTAEELEIALECGFDLIGVNNRNLVTFRTSVDVSLELAPSIPSDVVKVSESGIGEPAQIRRLEEAGFDAVLVGESLMRLPEPGRGIPRLLAG